MYLLRFTKPYDETYSAVIKEDQEKEKRAEKALNFLRLDPFYPSLKTHRVNTRMFGERWSSWVTGDLRIIWDFDPEERMVIILLAIVTHTGTHREYK